MKNFYYYAPTQVVFGKDTEKQVGQLVKKYGGTKVLLHYGGQSAIKSGLLAKVEECLAAEGIEFVKLGGVVPNPRLSLVRKARLHKIRLRAIRRNAIPLIATLLRRLFLKILTMATASTTLRKATQIMVGTFPKLAVPSLPNLVQLRSLDKFSIPVKNEASSFR